MRLRSFKNSALVIILLIAFIFNATPSRASFDDIENNWAEESILSLEEQGLFVDLWSDEFLPHGSITHATALDLVTRAFDLTEEEREALNDWLSDLLVGHDEGITRGEFAALVANPLGLGTKSDAPKMSYPTFADLRADYPGFLAIEFLQQLKLFPSHMLGRFEPYRLITRSEMAHILDHALQYEQIEGVVSEFDHDEKMVLQIDEEETEIKLATDTMYMTDLDIISEEVAKESLITKGDRVKALTKDQTALVINLEKENASLALLRGFNKLGQAVADVLTPAQVSALISGDWEQLGEEVRYEVYQELVERGLNPWEAEALMKQEWSSLQNMVEDRLTQEAADYLQVAPELIDAAVRQEWSKLLEYAQVELAQRLLTSEWLNGIIPN